MVGVGVGCGVGVDGVGDGGAWNGGRGLVVCVYVCMCVFTPHVAFVRLATTQASSKTYICQKFERNSQNVRKVHVGSKHVWVCITNIDKDGNALHSWYSSDTPLLLPEQ